MAGLTPLVWTVLAIGALVVGLSKTAVPGGGTVAVALFAAVLPARESTGALLVLLIVGDMFALLSYRRHADWSVIARMAPAVVVGLAAGWAFLAIADDAWVRRLIAVLLLLVVAVTLWRRRQQARSGAEPAVGSGAVAAWSYGSLGGFTTMVANAAGPVMSMYFLAARFPVKAFLGTSAWFFALVNVAKLPFSIGLGIVTPSSLLMDLLLVPAVVVGALVGRRLAGRMDQVLFDRLVIALTIAGALYLLL
ncbi:sulfite exporter TauE/SafE family protein [Microbacterium betulae]|uniref:sulfite exporter TauE/SafE family protein n=1 Tax=Microbacterium betulae TaxID=2981139 RepID=UPI003743A835